MLEVCLLGTGGMKPLPDRALTAMLLRHNGKMFLTDCGEGTQVQIAKCGWGFKEIGWIFFTHYHADHIAGLPGLLLTIGNSGRTEDLCIYGPPGLVQVISGLSVIFPGLPYNIVCYELPDDRTEQIYAGGLVISSMPVLHRIPCFAYSFELKRKGRFLADKATALNIPVQFWRKLQMGETIKHDNRTIAPSDVLGPERKGIKITYSTDTRPLDKLAEFAQGSDLFICEGIYAEKDKLDKATEYRHMIFEEAAITATEADVKELWLTHFSSSLKNPEEHLESVRRIFPNACAGTDLKWRAITFND